MIVAYTDDVFPLSLWREEVSQLNDSEKIFQSAARHILTNL